MRRTRWCVALFLLCSFLGCGGGGGGAGSTPTGPITISTPTTNVSLPVSGAQTFSAAVTNTNNSAVSWRVVEGAAGGTITQAGLYKAPPTVGVYHVVVTSQADGADTLTITVNVHVLITISPTSATLVLGQSQIFTAAVVGAADTAVSWGIEEGAAGGTLDASTGTYWAAIIPGTYHVIVTSQFDSTQTAVATVTVVGGSATGTIQ